MKILNHTIRPWQYFNVLLTMGLVTILESEIAFIRKDMINTPYILASAISSMFGDPIAGITGLVSGTLCLIFVSPAGLNFRRQNLDRVVGFVLTTLIIFYLARRSRRLLLNNMSLADSLKHFDNAAKKLKSQVRLDKKDLQRLNGLNKELRTLVDDIMDNDELWAGSVKRVVQQRDKNKELDDDPSRRP